MKKVVILLILIFLGCGGQSTEPKKVPQITVAPKVGGITVSSAEISWETDISANSVVRYGEQSGRLDLSTQSDAQETVHSIRLISLKTGSTYYYVAESSNKSGTATSAEFSFSTLASLEQLISSAWLNYQQGNYGQAITLFKTILQNYSRNTVAMTGLGWCYLASPIDSLKQAVSYFDQAIALDANYQDALAGRGLALLAQKSYSRAITSLEKVLQLNSAYIFSHNPSITAADLRLALAMAYFYKQDYSTTQSYLDILAPGNGLHPQDTTTWLVDGTSYLSYPEALLAWIEKLRRG